MYTVLLTISFFDVIQTGFVIYLWSKLYYDTPLITYAEPIPSAPKLN